MSKRQEPKTAVVLRIDHDGNEPFAMFPELPGDHHSGRCSCWTPYGHTTADYEMCIANSRAADKIETDRMLRELQRAGYENLRVLRRAGYVHHQRRRVAQMPWLSK